MSGVPSLQTPVDNMLWRQTILKLFNLVGRGAGAMPYPVTLGASPFTFTNTNQYALDVVILGGTVSALTFQRSIQGRTTTVTLPTASGIVRLSQGDAMTLTYTGTPTLQAIPR